MRTALLPAALLSLLLTAAASGAPFRRPRAEPLIESFSRNARAGQARLVVFRSSGELLLSSMDARSYGSALPLALLRVHRSMGATTKASGLLGPGWALAWEHRVRKLGKGAVLDSAGGDRLLFQPKPGQGLRCRLHPALRLDADALGFRLRDPDWSARFDPSGRLIELRRGGALLQVSRRSDGSPQRLSIGAKSKLELTVEGHRLRAVVDPAGRRWSYRYDKTGRLSQVDSPAKLTVRYRYDATGRLQSVRRAGRPTLAIAYDSEGRVAALSEGGRSEHIRYPGEALPETPAGAELAAELSLEGPQGRLIARQAGAKFAISGPELALDFDRNKGRLEASTPSGRWALQRNAQGRVSELQNPLGGRFHFSYDARGRLNEMVDPSGARSKLEYEAERLVALTDPEGGRSEYGYDAEGRLASIIDPAKRAMRFRHDALGRLTRFESMGGAASFGYDAADRLTSLGDGAAGRFGIQYDESGRITAMVDGAGAKSRFRWQEGNVAEVIDPLGRGSAASAAKPRPGPRLEEVIARNPAGQPIELRNEAAWLTISYDKLGRAVQITDKRAQAPLAIRSDKCGRRVALKTPWGERLIRRDKAGRVLAFSIPGLGEIRRHYGPRGLLREELPGGVSIDYKRATDGSLLALTRRRGETILEERSYQYDAAGRLVSEQRGSKTKAKRFTYDAAGQLLAVNGGAESRFRYDRTGALIERPGEASEGTKAIAIKVDAKGQLSALGERRYEHDEQGRRQRRRSGKELLDYRYDDHNRLLEVRQGARPLVSFSYDPLGRPVLRRAGSQTRRRVFDGDRVIAELDEEGQVRARYVWGEGPTELLAVELEGRWALVHRERNGSVSLLTDGSGKVVARYRYSPFGRCLEAKGELAAQNPYRFAARPLDPITGLYDMRARVYDPETGRFLSPDPAGRAGGLSPYSYCHNDPINHIDPSGRLPHVIVGALVGAVLGAGTSIGLALLNGEKVSWRDTVAMTVAGAAIGGLFAGTGGMAFFANHAVARAGRWAFGGGAATGLEETIANLLHGRPWHENVAYSTALGAGTGLLFFGVGNIFGKLSGLLSKAIPRSGTHHGLRGGASTVSAIKGKALLIKAKTAAALMVDNVVLVVKELFGGVGEKEKGSEKGEKSEHPGVNDAGPDEPAKTGERVKSPGVKGELKKLKEGAK